MSGSLFSAHVDELHQLGLWLRKRTPIDDPGLVAVDYFERLLMSAEAFARHDPGVDWPGEKHDDPLDAIMAALDRVREELAVEVDR